MQVYRDWRALHGPEQPVPGGESRLGALARYADGCARLLARRDARCVLLVVHDIPIRFLRNALLRADPAGRAGAHRREPRAPERERGAAGRRARGHAAEAVRPSAGLTGR